MFTASHNPPQYNGIKFCLKGAAPVGQDTGLQDIRTLAEAGPSPRQGADLFDLRTCSMRSPITRSA